MPRRTVVDPTFPARLRELRKAAGLTQQMLARAAYVGKSTISELENGRANPIADTASALDRVLHAGGELAGMVAEPPESDRTARLAQEPAAEHADALADALAARLLKDLPDAVADKTAAQINDEWASYSPQGWHTEAVHPPWSGFCWTGDHPRCDGTAPPAPECHCPHHHGEPIPEFGYRLRIDDYGRLYSEPRTEPHPRFHRPPGQEEG